MWDLRFASDGAKRWLQLELHEEDGRTQVVRADISEWKAMQPHHVLASWNVHTGRVAIYVDGKLGQAVAAPGGLNLNPDANRLRFHQSGGRPAANVLLGPVRISRVERIPGSSLPQADVDARAMGVEIWLARP